MVLYSGGHLRWATSIEIVPKKKLTLDGHHCTVYNCSNCQDSINEIYNVKFTVCSLCRTKIMELVDVRYLMFYE